jgi:hypothetical protein
VIASTDLIQKFMEAVAVAEGYGKPGPTKCCNNPGNLTDDNEVYGFVQTHGPNGAKITKFPTPAIGWEALRKKVSRMLQGQSHSYPIQLTIAEVAQRWSGDANWGFNVAKCLGVTPNTKLSELVENDPKSQDLKWPNA